MEYKGGQLYEEDMEFIYEKEDLVTLRPGREYAWLDGLLERMLQILRCKLIKVSPIAPILYQSSADNPPQYFFCPKVSSRPQSICHLCFLAG